MTPVAAAHVRTSLSVKSARTPSLGTFFAMTVTMTCDSVWYQSCLREQRGKALSAAQQYTCYRARVAAATPASRHE